jgi:hypothetical protein
VLAFPSKIADVVQWQNISFPRCLIASGVVRLGSLKTLACLRIHLVWRSLSFGVDQHRLVTSVATSNVTTSQVTSPILD